MGTTRRDKTRRGGRVRRRWMGGDVWWAACTIGETVRKQAGRSTRWRESRVICAPHHDARRRKIELCSFHVERGGREYFGLGSRTLVAPVGWGVFGGRGGVLTLVRARAGNSPRTGFGFLFGARIVGPAGTKLCFGVFVDPA